MAVQRHSLFQNNLIDVIINSKTWASAQQRLVVKVGFIMLTFGKPTRRSHFWMRSSSSVFFTALSPTKHVACFTFFLHFSVGGKHGQVKAEQRLPPKRETDRRFQMLAHTIDSCHSWSHLIRSAPWQDVCGKMLKLKVRAISNDLKLKWWEQFPSMGRKQWRGMDFCLVNL